MCEECLATKPRRRIEPSYCGCGCLAIRRFLTPEEKIELQEDYKKQLEKEIAGIEVAVKEIKQRTK